MISVTTKQSGRRYVVSLVCLLPLVLNGCLELISPGQKPAKRNIEIILGSSPESWTVAQCEAVVKKFTAFNKKGYQSKISDYSIRTEDVYIKVTPLNEAVIAARIRKDAINKRWPLKAYRERLKVELEDYTNFTLDVDTGKIKSKQVPADSLLKEFSFLVHFENISLPFRNIEVYKAHEGFFLEDASGKYSRVIDFWGSEVEENFVLVSDLKGTITFSALTDDGEELQFDQDTMKGCQLVFNGLQTKPVIVKW